MHTASLRSQLLKRLLWPILIILLLGAVLAYLFALNAATEAYDLGLLDNALDLSKQVKAGKGELALELPLAARQMLQANNEDRVNYAAWNESGQLFSGTPELLKLVTHDTDENYFFRDLVLNGEEIRAVVIHEKVAGNNFYIAVSQTTHGRNRLKDRTFASILLPEALIALASITVIFFGVRQGLSPVELLRDEIISRSPNDLRPIEETHAPIELAPIIHGINDLLEKLAASFTSHKRFIADAAHQLRTPLASLSSQIEVGLQNPSADTASLLQQLLGTARRTTHLANQLLSLARLEHTEQSMFKLTPIGLREVCLETSADFVTQAARKGVELDFNLEPVQAQGNAFLLRELLANLLDNAVRNTPAGGEVKVGLHTEAHGVLLTVEDNGQGVPEAELGKLGTPFHSLASSPAGGCGLGLSIVLEITRLHNAKILFGHGANKCGLRVTIEFPSTTTAVS